MNNRVVVVELDRPRSLKFGRKALAMIEETFNCSILELDSIINEKMKSKDATKLMYFGLMHEDETLTIEKLEDLLDEHMSIIEQIEKISEGIEKALSKDMNKNKNNSNIDNFPNAKRTAKK